MASRWQSVPHFSVGDSVYVLGTSSERCYVILSCRWNDAVGEWFYEMDNHQWYRQSEIIGFDDWKESW